MKISWNILRILEKASGDLQSFYPNKTRGEIEVMLLDEKEDFLVDKWIQFIEEGNKIFQSFNTKEWLLTTSEKEVPLEADDFGVLIGTLLPQYADFDIVVQKDTGTTPHELVINISSSTGSDFMILTPASFKEVY